MSKAGKFLAEVNEGFKPIKLAKVTDTYRAKATGNPEYQWTIADENGDIAHISQIFFSKREAWEARNSGKIQWKQKSEFV